MEQTKFWKKFELLCRKDKVLSPEPFQPFGLFALWYLFCIVRICFVPSTIRLWIEVAYSWRFDSNMKRITIYNNENNWMSKRHQLFTSFRKWPINLSVCNPLESKKTNQHKCLVQTCPTILSKWDEPIHKKHSVRTAAGSGDSISNDECERDVNDFKLLLLFAIFHHRQKMDLCHIYSWFILTVVFDTNLNKWQYIEIQMLLNETIAMKSMEQCNRDVPNNIFSFERTAASEFVRLVKMCWISAHQ